MYPVVLIEGGVRRNSIEKKRIEQCVVSLGEIRIDRVEGVCIFGVEIARRHHTDKQDGQASLIGQAREQFVKRVSRNRRIDRP